MIVCMTTKNSWWHCLMMYTLVNKYDFDFDFDDQVIEYVTEKKGEIKSLP
jgi:hypothetical protein